MVLTYFVSDFEMVTVAPIITGITLVFTFHIRCIYIVKSLYFKIFSVYFRITFLFPGIPTFMNIYVPFLLSRIKIYGLLLGMVLSVCTCWFLSMITLPPRFVSTDFGIYYYYYYFLWLCSPLLAMAFSYHEVS
jgi:hypothetical protein